MSTPNKLFLYGIEWNTTDLVRIESAIIKAGYKPFEKPTGETPFHHWKSYLTALFPSRKWNRWRELILQEYLTHQELALVGPASSGKTGSMAELALAEWWIAPECTSVIVSTTTIKLLQQRILGEIMMLFREAKKLRPWLEGYYRSSLPGIVLSKAEDDGRDLRNAIFGIACKTGSGEEVGLGDYAGIKNKHVRLFADEGSAMSGAFIKGAGNLASNHDFKMVVSGNPSDPTDSLGIFAEPHPDEGGWEGLEQGEKTRTWRNRRLGGGSVQLVGTDSPNLDFPEDSEPFPFLMGRNFLRKKEADYGKNSKDYNREALGHMLVGGSRRRVISTELCRQRGATEPPAWASASQIKTVVGVDTAYTAVGGDRSVLVELSWGPEVSGKIVMCPMAIPIIIPMKNIRGLPAEDQIAEFCKEYCESRGIPPDMFGFDGSGRSSLTSSLARLWSPSVHAIEFGGQATERPLGSKIPNCRLKYDRFVSELWFASREIIDAGQMRGLTDPYIKEGCMREWVEKIGGRQSVVPKDVMKELLGYSPDIFDALVTAIEMARRKGFHILSGNPSTTTRPKTPDWIKQRHESARRFSNDSVLSTT